MLLEEIRDQRIKELKSKSKEQIFDFIRETLSCKNIINDLRHINRDEFIKEHRRFDMSGYDGDEVGHCTVKNMDIVNEFAFLGIYDYTHYLFIDFYKGGGWIHLRYWNEKQETLIDLDSIGTVEMIYTIFELTIFTDKRKRRRN